MGQKRYIREIACYYIDLKKEHAANINIFLSTQIKESLNHNRFGADITSKHAKIKLIWY